MRNESKSILKAVHTWVSANKARAVKSRNTAKTEQHRLMMAGKAKAYLDVICFIENRWGIK